MQIQRKKLYFIKKILIIILTSLFLKNEFLKIEKPQFKSFYPVGYNFKLNFYKKKCGKIFNYKRNNEKDLVILAYEFQNKSLEHNLFMEMSIKKILKSIKISIPLAHLICFVPIKSLKSKIVSRLIQFGIEIIKIPNSNEKIVNRRFIESYNYLKKKKIYERILLMDLKDVFIFDDIFATIGPNDFFVNYNCNKESKNLENCNKFFNSINKKWLHQNMNGNNTNIKEVNKFLKINPTTLVAGVFIGGIKYVFKFLELFSHKLIQFNNKNQMQNFGYDQVLFNYLFYLGYFDKFHLKAIGCEQRMCFLPQNLLFNKIKNEVFYEYSGCPPILIHKFYPNSWIKKQLINNLIN
jgi:hypothetical protein